MLPCASYQRTYIDRMLTYRVLGCTYPGPALNLSRCPPTHRRLGLKWSRNDCQAVSKVSTERGQSAVLEKSPSPAQPAERPPGSKTRVVVLGSGWGAISFLKNIDPKEFGEHGQYELTIISPRNYFLFTPLLPSAVSGTVEERSIVEPVRNLVHGKGQFYEAECLDIDPHSRTLTCVKEFCEVCRARKGVTHSAADHTFAVQYDVLLLAVGSVNNTFGIPGVGEYCWFLKNIDQAHKLRVHMSKAIEQAGLPTTSPENRRRLLSFVVVGGGPTGCELAAELHDLVKEDVEKLFPHLKGEVRITLIETLDHLLNAYDRQIAEYAKTLFDRQGVSLMLGTRVLSVEDGMLTAQPRGKEEQKLEFGTCVWATGVGMNPLVRSLKEKLPPGPQTSPSGLVVDRTLGVKGWDGSIMAIGDAAVTNQDKALDLAADLFAAAGGGKGSEGRLSEPQVLDILKKSMKEYPQMGELVHQVEELKWAGGHPRSGGKERGGGVGMGGGGVMAASPPKLGSAMKMSMYTKHIQRLQKGLTYEEFRELLADMDSMLRALPATAQVARQEGEYLAALFSARKVQLAAPAPEITEGAGAPAGASAPKAPLLPSVKLEGEVEAFKYTHLGSLAYLGMDRAVMQLPSTFPMKILKGWLVGHAWRGMETFMQISMRNRWMVLNDWLNTKLFGRNLSDV